MIWALISVLVFLAVAYLVYRSLKSEPFASPEEKADFLIQNGKGASDYQEFRSRTAGGYNLDFYKMKNLDAQGALTVANLAKQLI